MENANVQRFCPNCGAQNTESKPFCPNCGTPLSTAQTTPNNAGAQQQYTPGYNPPQGTAYSPQNGVPYVAYTASAAPVGQLKTNRSLIKLILLSLITFGIYSIVFMSSISNDINIIASRYDGKKTMHYCLLIFIIAPLTLGIAGIVWCHKISARIGNELRRRGNGYMFSASDYWLWNVLGSLIVVGPFIYYHKLAKAMNKLSEHYNRYG